jgi:hypothetical protein
MREDPIISGSWLKAALIILVGGALGVGAYLLASDVDINLPDIDLNTTSTATNLSDTTIEDTTIDRPANPDRTIQELQQLSRCTQEAQGDIERINACFDEFRR